MKNKHFWDNFINAARGILTAIKNERHMKLHIFATVIVISLSIYYRISRLELIAIIITISTVITAEMINTAVEAVVDLATQDYNEKAKLAKDVAAGAVLVAALFSVAIGFFVFYDRIKADVIKLIELI
ncbi:MAG TPA: diacylglycerol kinase [Pseudobacteroides sp.]|uniref:diacylglycerol kinase n=1 Tax=Pseudobacteroides sp. TaxID=1968840 RepID=UPI002F948070